MNTNNILARNNKRQRMHNMFWIVTDRVECSSLSMMGSFPRKGHKIFLILASYAPRIGVSVMELQLARL